MLRRTKIVCTIGPSTQSYEMIKELMLAGMNVARLNFSHGTHEEHAQRIVNIRRAEKELGCRVAILQDLQGPKIRIGRLANDEFPIHPGEELILTTEPLEISGRDRVYVTYPALVEEVVIGNRILIDDGNIELEVMGTKGNNVITKVILDGILKSRKGVNLPNIKTASTALTEKDLVDLEFGLKADIDWIALSFVRSASDVQDLVDRIKASGENRKVVAKIEKPEALLDLRNIINVADAIMVARGDLGIEMPMERVPLWQKEIIRRALDQAKPVITATQMLESMTQNPRPTRAEASDVANAVWDGTDAVMLSAETASGEFPLESVRAMAAIIDAVEGSRRETHHSEHIEDDHGEVTEAISSIACQIAKTVRAKAIVCLTHSGATARSIARHRPRLPIYACIPDEKVISQMSLLWGTSGFMIEEQDNTDSAIRAVHEKLKSKNLVKDGDLIVLTAGMPFMKKGQTNMVHVSRIE
jgi:pyruvate kinase